MKKVILSNIALILAGFLSAPAQNDTPKTEQFNGSNTRFENPKLSTPKKIKSEQDWWEPDTIYLLSGIDVIFSRHIFKYGSSGLLSEEIRQDRIDINSWTNKSLFNYTYDSNNNLVKTFIQEWKNNSWVDFETYTYNYTYDSNNNVLSDGSWTYTYDTNNNLLTKANGNDLYTYAYDSDNKKLDCLAQYQWGSYLSTYNYDTSNNLLNELVQSWRNNSWENAHQFNYTYNDNNNRLTEQCQVWSGSSNSWHYASYEQRMIYDENGNCISVEYWTWDGETWQPFSHWYISKYLYYNNMQSTFEWKFCDKMTASYIKVSDFTSIANPPTTPELNTISIYPNPTKGELRVKSEELRVREVQIFDVYGRKQLITLNSSLLTHIDVSHLPAGIYFVQITTGQGVVTKKVVKM